MRVFLPPRCPRSAVSRRCVGTRPKMPQTASVESREDVLGSGCGGVRARGMPPGQGRAGLVRCGRRLVRTNEEVDDTRSEAERPAPQVDDVYPPIRDLAAIGDGRTIALVSL